MQFEIEKLRVEVEVYILKKIWFYTNWSVVHSVQRQPLTFVNNIWETDFNLSNGTAKLFHTKFLKPVINNNIVIISYIGMILSTDTVNIHVWIQKTCNFSKNVPSLFFFQNKNWPTLLPRLKIWGNICNFFRNRHYGNSRYCTFKNTLKNPQLI